MLKGKKILLAVTGSIAAYKAAILIRLLVKSGSEVKVIMTPLAKEFISPLTLATLSKNPILVEFFDPENGNWNSHVDLGIWADAFVIAPATANTMAKVVHGIADNLLLTTYLSARCPVFVAPAMDLDMYAHQTTTLNIIRLKELGVHVIEPSTGELASGLDGKGRMEDPEKITDYLENYFSNHNEIGVQALKGKNVLITAGPTFEPIDPVRFIGNHSSGKMGYALANKFANAGANVTLISGPVNEKTGPGLIEVIKINTAQEMLKACSEHFPGSDIAVFSAAVADYRPQKTIRSKIKTTEDKIELKLVRNPDIAFEMSKIKKKGQYTVGFALETDNEKEYAKKKLDKKNFDMIILNSLNDAGAGFGHDTNKITVISKDNKITDFGLKTKNELAEDIVKIVLAKAFK